MMVMGFIAEIDRQHAISVQQAAKSEEYKHQAKITEAKVKEDLQVAIKAVVQPVPVQMHPQLAMPQAMPQSYQPAYMPPGAGNAGTGVSTCLHGSVSSSTNGAASADDAAAIDGACACTKWFL